MLHLTNLDAMIAGNEGVLGVILTSRGAKHYMLHLTDLDTIMAGNEGVLGVILTSRGSNTMCSILLT